MTRPAHPRTGRRALAAVTVTALSALVAGCGVRATSVPVDAGAAPSRVGCVLPDDRATAQPQKGATTARVYLVCSARVSSVDRQVKLPESDSAAERTAVAARLLTALQAAPDSGEEAAGFGTDVPRDLNAEKPQADDPEGTLRLSVPPPELPGFALAQIVCTVADSDLAGRGGSVTLGGPRGAGDVAGQAQRYTCDSTLRTRAGAAKTAGTPA